ncbi:hypothetical protein VE25_13290 [Devosia geojensis]|uniref:DNA-binding protein n=1 Tax=Devosia geojensis TaxID=443610 RepID=A0A0F5FQX6_9HYPH|nr:zinc ribbon domain-containing protein [Devosia geojensis]KKB11289.1 hypothetical protein VE25_13290 [Devosia geojensis]
MISAADLAALDVPGPTVSALSAPFWEAADSGRLLVQHCKACDYAFLYPRRICPRCWSDDLNWREAAGRAILKTCSTIFKPGHPGWQPAAPYSIGIVALEEGPTLLTHLRVDPENLAADMQLRVVFMNIGGRTLPCFESAP